MSITILMKGQITGIIMTTADSGGRCRRTAMLMIPEEAVREAAENRGIEVVEY